MRTLLAVAALAFACTAHAQAPTRVTQIAILHPGSVATHAHLQEAFVRGLADLGYVDGKNVRLETRYAEGKLDRLPALVQELATRKIDVWFAPSALASDAIRKGGVTAPIVFAVAPDPVGEGFARSLAHPGGNMTGLTSQSPEVASKRVDLIREAFPKTSRIAVLYALNFPGVPAELAEIERAVHALGKEYRAVEAKRVEDIEPALAEIAKWRADVLLVVENPMFFFNRKSIAGLAQKHRLPAIYRSSDYVDAGGLMSYGASYADLCRRAAAYVDRIVRGASPGSLPIEQPVKFELVLNRSAAKSIGIALPRDLLLRADRLVE
ncbi:MAG: ABC transporter substrate-binding protein [Burkholderiales bacterium]|nr:ABC transporter substrate-binding protein [Burkholderiales bacterium]